MYNVLIVDDDVTFITYLKALIDWNACQCCVTGGASNGWEALELLKKNQIDIVFTDMNMPVMNGVELIKACKSSGSEAVFVALSGFKDFDYVKESLKSGAVDYIIKHNLSDNCLFEVLQKAIGQIKERHSVNDDSIYQHYKKDMSREIIKNMLFDGVQDKVQFAEMLNQFNMGALICGTTLILLEIDNYEQISLNWKDKKQQQRYLRTVEDICQNILDDLVCGTVLHIESKQFALLYSTGNISMQLTLEKTQQIASRLSNSLKRSLNISCCMAVSALCADITKLDELYLDTSEKLHAKFYKGPGQVFFEKDLPQVTAPKEIIIEENYIRQCLLKCQSKEVLNYIVCLFSRFEQQRLGKNSVQNLSVELCALALLLAKSNAIPAQKLYPDNRPPYMKLQAAETAQQMQTVVCTVYNLLFGQLESRHFLEKYSDSVQKAIAYIFNNYMNNISLEDVSAHIGVNSAYLSRIFKKEVEKGFVEYLNSYRIEIAKELIKQDERLKNIVQKAGFSSYNYFFRVFREITGETPQEYKKNSSLK